MAAGDLADRLTVPNLCAGSCGEAGRKDAFASPETATRALKWLRNTQGRRVNVTRKFQCGDDVCRATLCRCAGRCQLWFLTSAR